MTRSSFVRAAGPLARAGALVCAASLFASPLAVDETRPAETKRLNVFVQLTRPPLARAGTAVAANGVDVRAAQLREIGQINAEQDRFLSAMKRAGLKATIVYRVARARNGVALLVAPGELDALRRLPGVKSVEILEPEQPAHSSKGSSPKAAAGSCAGAGPRPDR